MIEVNHPKLASHSCALHRRTARGGELVYRYGLGVMPLPQSEGEDHDHEHKN
jgi:hypothetical protein